MLDKDEVLKNDFEDSIEKSLKSIGYLFPSTDDEVEAFERENKIEITPSYFPTALELVSKSKRLNICKKINMDINSSTENLARAARKGNDISEDVLKKMKLDRDAAENGEK